MQPYDSSPFYDIMNICSILRDKVVTMSKVIKRPNGLYGAEGLMVSIIALAADDAVGAYGKQHIASAWAYINQTSLPNGARWPLPYGSCMELLGLPDDWRPAAIDQLSVDELKQLYARIDNE